MRKASGFPSDVLDFSEAMPRGRGVASDYYYERDGKAEPYRIGLRQSLKIL